MLSLLTFAYKSHWFRTMYFIFSQRFTEALYAATTASITSSSLSAVSRQVLQYVHSSGQCPRLCLHSPLVPLADGFIGVGGEVSVSLVDAVVCEVDEAVGEGLHRSRVPTGRRVIGDMRRVIGDMRRVIGDMRRVIGDMRRVIGDMRRVIGDMRRVIGDMRRVVGDMRRVIGDMALLQKMLG